MNARRDDTGAAQEDPADGSLPHARAAGEARACPCSRAAGRARVDGREGDAASPQDDGSFALYSLPASRFRAEMRPSRIRGASAGKVGLVSRKIFEKSGESLGAVSL